MGPPRVPLITLRASVCAHTQEHAQTSVFAVRGGAPVFSELVFRRNCETLLGDQEAGGCGTPSWAPAVFYVSMNCMFKSRVAPTGGETPPGFARSTSDKWLPVLTPQSAG